MLWGCFGRAIHPKCGSMRILSLAGPRTARGDAFCAVRRTRRGYYAFLIGACGMNDRRIGCLMAGLRF
jgi:hypothetical protein